MVNKATHSQASSDDAFDQMIATADKLCLAMTGLSRGDFLTEVDECGPSFFDNDPGGELFNLWAAVK